MLNRFNLPIVENNQPMDPFFPIFATEFVQDLQSMSCLHYHRYIEIARCVHGSGVQFIEGQFYPFSERSIAVIAKDCIHESCILRQFPNEEPSIWQYLFIDTDKMGIENAIDQSFMIESRQAVCLFDLIYEFCTTEGRESFQQIVLLLRVLMLELHRMATQKKPIKQGPYSDIIVFVLHHIATNYASDLTVANLAKECNMSTSYFRKLFLETVGVSPQQYIIQIRLNMAEQLLRTTKRPIQEIANDVGFRTLSSFNRLFKKKNGCAPKLIR